MQMTEYFVGAGHICSSHLAASTLTSRQSRRFSSVLSSPMVARRLPVVALDSSLLRGCGKVITHKYRATTMLPIGQSTCSPDARMPLPRAEIVFAVAC